MPHPKPISECDQTTRLANSPPQRLPNYTESLYKPESYPIALPHRKKICDCNLTSAFPSTQKPDTRKSILLNKIKNIFLPGLPCLSRPPRVPGPFCLCHQYLSRPQRSLFQHPSPQAHPSPPHHQSSASFAQRTYQIQRILWLRPHPIPHLWTHRRLG